MHSNSNNERFFNNADSFGIAFDKAWRAFQTDPQVKNTSQAKKLELVLESIKDHPFLQKSPLKAKEVAEFRIRLLGLS